MTYAAIASYDNCWFSGSTIQWLCASTRTDSSTRASTVPSGRVRRALMVPASCSSRSASRAGSSRRFAVETSMSPASSRPISLRYGWFRTPSTVVMSMSRRTPSIDRPVLLVTNTCRITGTRLCANA